MENLHFLLGRNGLQLIGAIAVGYGLVRLVRWIHRESPLLAAIVASGLVLRAGLGVLLFWISYLDLPVLRGLHTSDGFWIVAPDARDYFIRAATAAEEGLGTIGTGTASPGYVQFLAMFMRVAGISPASGLFLNLVMYTVLSSLVVFAWKPRRDWRQDLPCIVLLASFAFAPSLVIHGTQPLKDDLFAFFIATGSLGVLVTVIPVIYGRHAIRSRWIALAGLGGLMVAVFFAAGIRTYYAFFMLVSLTIVLASFAPRLNPRDLVRTVLAAAFVVTLTAVAYTKGAGAYDFYLSPLLSWEEGVTPNVAAASNGGSKSKWRRSWTSTQGVLRYIEIARFGFRNSGGETNVAPVPPRPEPVAANPPNPAAPDPGVAAPVAPVPAVQTASVPAAPAASAPAVPSASPPVPAPAATSAAAATDVTSPTLAAPPPIPEPPTPAAPAPAPSRWALAPSDLGTSVKQLLVGLSTLYVPISILRALSIVSFSGGRGLLLITDIDTIFLDLTIAASLFLLYRRWSTARQYLPYVCFLLLLSLGSAVLMAYVVTNFGTIFRLRMMPTVPIWMLGMAMTSGRFMMRSGLSDPDRSAVSTPALAGTPG